MCLVKMKVEHEDEIPSPPRRIVVRPVSQHGSDRIVVAHRLSTSSRPVSRSRSHRSSQRSSRVISIVDPAPTATSRPTQYILSPSAAAAAAAAGHRASIPRIIHAAPSPPRSPRLNSSPRVSYASVHSSRNSPRGSRSRVVSDGEIVYVSTERERGTTELRRRPRSTGPFLTTAAAAMAASGSGRGSREEVIDTYGYVEPARQHLYLEDRDGNAGGLRPRTRSITYATTGPRLSRERVLIEQDGRRRESYQVIGSR